MHAPRHLLLPPPKVANVWSVKRSGGGAAGSTREGSTSDGSDQNVVDADFEVIDEDKKKS